MPKFRKFRKYTFRFFGGSILIGGMSVGGLLYFDEGFRRQAQFYRPAIPILAHYKLMEYTHEYVYQTSLKNILKLKDNRTLNDKYEDLHQLYAQKILDIILDLKGLYVKAGQFGSGRPDVVPEVWIEKFRTLQDGVPPQKMDYVRDVIKSEMGKDIDEIFSEFKEESLGAASIGQAHYAKLKPCEDNDFIETEVCVKLQYPEMERVFKADISAIRTFVGFLEPAIGDALKEMEDQFLKEFDYIKEAENLQVAYDNMKPFSDDVEVPKPYKNLCTRNVLVMSYLPGDKLEIAVRKKLKQILNMTNKLYGNGEDTLDDNDQVSFADFRRQMMTQKPEHNPLLPVKYYFYLNYIRRKLYNSMAYVFNHTLVYLFYPLLDENEELPYIQYDINIVPNTKHFIETLLKVHGHQIFVNAAFNGDPHPGNILLMPNGKLGLIDYGQFKYLTNDERRELSKLYIALVNKDYDGIVSQANVMGLKTKNNDKDFIYKFTSIGFDRIDADFREGKSVIEFMTELQKQDKVVKIPGNYYLVNRTVFLLRGLAALLQHDISVAQYWYPFAQGYLDGKYN